MPLVNLLVPRQATTTSTGTQDDYDFESTRLLCCDNSSLLTLRGLASGSPGQRLTLVSVGGGRVDLVNDDANSAPANRIVAGVNGAISLAAAAGRCELVYDGTAGRWRVLSHEQGDWITPSFAAGDYTGNGAMTWTVDSGDVSSAAYYLRGRVLNVNLKIVNSSVGGTPNSTLRRVIPGDLTAAQYVDFVYYGRDNGTFFSGGVGSVSGGSTLIQFLVNASFAGWQASTNASNVSANIAIPVQ